MKIIIALQRQGRQIRHREERRKFLQLQRGLWLSFKPHVSPKYYVSLFLKPLRFQMVQYHKFSCEMCSERVKLDEEEDNE